MGCVSSLREEHDSRYARPNKTHHVCVTCTSRVWSPEDFASFFSVWIAKICGELKLSVASGRPKFGDSILKPGSKEEKALHAAVVASRVLVCIANFSLGEEWPPPGYSSEVAWAVENRIPVVCFYDGDRYRWKEVCSWKADLPGMFNSGFGPVRYHRKSHEEAKRQLSSTIQDVLAEVADEQEEGEGEAAGGEKSSAERSAIVKFADDELSVAERKLRRGVRVRPEGTEAPLAIEDGVEDAQLGFQRSDFERAGLVEKQLERSDSLKDITIETALAMLAKQATSEQVVDKLAARDGGCRLQFVAGYADEDTFTQNNEPKHRIVEPAKGILKGTRKKTSSGPPAKKQLQLRLAPVGHAEDRRHCFAVQQLQQHLESLQPDDVHELMTVLRCLQHGLEEHGLVTRALRLIKAFLELHSSLHGRAVQLGAIPAIVAAMTRHAEVDMLSTGMAALVAVLEGDRALEIVSEDQKEMPGGKGHMKFFGKAECAAAITQSGGLETITVAMRQFASCEFLQEAGCRCMGLLCRASDDNKVASDYEKGQKQETSVYLRSQARRLIVRHSGVSLLLSAMRRFPRTVRLQAGACMALSRIGSSEERVKRRAGKRLGIVALLLTALDTHPTDTAVQRWGCAALRHLASNSQDNKTFIAKYDGVEKLCHAARNFQHVDKHVLAEALGALCHLASKHPENKQAILEVGAAQLTLAVLAERPLVDEVALAGCGLLHNLACDEDIKRHIVKYGGREVAEQLQSHGTQVVRNLAHVLKRTLAPREEPSSSSDPFGALFATRTPGAAARATSRRDRKKARQALEGAQADVGGGSGDCERGGSSKAGRAAAGPASDAKSEASDVSTASGTSAASSRSATSSAQRKPGESKRRRRSNHSEGTGASASAEVAASDISDAESHISLEANERLGDADLAAALGGLGKVRIRKKEQDEPQGEGQQRKSRSKKHRQ